MGFPVRSRHRYGHSSAAIAFLARSGLSSSDSTYVNAYYELIDGCVRDGSWSYLHALYILSTKTSAIALLNLVSTSYTATIAGSPFFTAQQGFTGVNSSSVDYIDTGFNPFVSALQNNFSFGIWSNTNVADNTCAMGSTDANSQCSLYPKFAGSAYFRNNDAIAGLSGGVGVATSVGYYVADRSGASAQNGLINNSDQSITPVASGTPPNASIYLLNMNGAAGNGWSGQASAAFIARSMNPSLRASLYTRIGAFRTSMGL